MNRNQFSNVERIYAFDLQSLQNIAVTKRALDKVPLKRARRPEKPGKSHTAIVGWRDRDGSDDLRPGILGKTLEPIPLTDGRHAVKGYWLKQIDANPARVGVDELTEREFKKLRIKSEDGI